MQVHCNGVELLSYFTGARPWRQLYSFLEMMPAWGRYKSALAMDHDYARRICDAEEKGEGHPPVGDDDDAEITPLDYSEVIARLDIIADRILLTRNAVVAGYAKDGKEPEFRPMTRPTTALDQERERRTRRLLEEVDALVREGVLLT